jgi:hypothetical protein
MKMRSVNQFCEVIKSVGAARANARGCPLYEINRDTDRYIVDFADDFTVEGWLQFDTDQDAHYFGAWVNPVSFRTLSYAEGDWCLCECCDREHYNAEIQDMIRFYGEGRIALVIARTGDATEIKQDRSKFLR